MSKPGRKLSDTAPDRLGDGASANGTVPGSRRPETPPTRREKAAEIRRARALVEDENRTLEADVHLIALAAALTAERLRQGLSTYDVMERGGISDATVRAIDSCTFQNPTVRALRRYALALGLELTWSLKAVEGKDGDGGSRGASDGETTDGALGDGAPAVR